MRTSALIPGLKNSQKVRVIIDGVGIFSTVKAVWFGTFVNISHNDSARYALRSLGQMRIDAKKIGDLMPVGLAKDAFGHQVQVDIF